ncbi:MAG: hypothetical protein KC502_22245, partial [Myxococcales bacterium]|nr:hypothetical protein [Myxococcales bacterium]
SDCTDSNACTDTKCDAGKCKTTFNTKPCDSGTPCSLGDACSSGKCTAGFKTWVTTEAGSGYAAFSDGPKLKANLNYPYGITFNAAGELVFADYSNHRVRKVDTNGAVVTVAGGAAGYVNAKGSQARFRNPRGIVGDASGNVFVVDGNNYCVRKIDKTGVTTQFAGTCTKRGYYNGGTVYGAAGTAQFYTPTGIALTADGTMYLALNYKHSIARIDSTGKAVHFSGGNHRAYPGYKNGLGSAVRFRNPMGLDVDTAGNLFVADNGNHVIRKVTPGGEATTVAGTGSYGHVNGAASTARFYHPHGLAVRGDGAIFVADHYNNRIRKIFGGQVSTIAGTGATGATNGIASSARFYRPIDVAIGKDGAVFVTDYNNHRVRAIKDSLNNCNINSVCYTEGITKPGNQCASCVPKTSTKAWSNSIKGTVCNDGDVCTHTDGCDGNGSCAATKTVCNDNDKCTADKCDASSGKCIFTPIIGCGGYCNVAKDCADGNACTDEKCDAGKCKVTNNTTPCSTGTACSLGDACSGGKCVAGFKTMVATYAGSGYPSFSDGPALKANLHYPYGMDFNAAGELVFADHNNHRVRKVDVNGSVVTIAGGAAGYVNAKGAQARFRNPRGVVGDKAGNIYVVDGNNYCVRKIDKTGVTTQFAGTCTKRGYYNGGTVFGAAGTAQFYTPTSLALTDDGVMYLSLNYKHSIARIDTTGKTVHFSGGNHRAYPGYTNGLGSAVRFRNPVGLDVDVAGNLYVADNGNHVIRKVTPGGEATTVAGTGSYGHVNGAVGGARFYHPHGVAVRGDGAIFVADHYNNRLRKIFGGQVSTVAGTGATGATNGEATQARFYRPLDVVIGKDGTVYMTDYNNHRIRSIKESANNCSISGVCYTEGVLKPGSQCASCVPKTNAKAWSDSAKGTVCNDGDPCTVKDGCNGLGACSATKTVCNDSDKCTNDKCDSVSGKCVYTPIIGCGGYCGKDTDCKDENPCTDDKCAGGKCAFTNNTKPCTSTEPCSLGDVCSAGKCVAKGLTAVKTVAGSGYPGYKDGSWEVAQFNQPYGMVRRKDGTVFIADYKNHRIRRLSNAGKVTTISGSTAGYTDGFITGAKFHGPIDMTIDSTGNLYVCEHTGHRIRKIDVKGQVTLLAGSTGTSYGYTNGKGSAVRFRNPYGIDAAGNGTVFVADHGNHAIRRVEADGSTTTIAGNGYGYHGFADGSGAAARFYNPIDLAFTNGYLLVTDYYNHRIRKVEMNGKVTTWAGTGSASYKDGAKLQAYIRYPRAIGVDAVGDVWFTTNYYRLRRVSGGVVSTVAGNPSLTDKDGYGTSAGFGYVSGMEFTPDGGLLLASTSAHRIKSVKMSAKNCKVGEACIRDGFTNAANTCQLCDFAKKKDGWTTLAAGTVCTDGKPCTTPDKCDSSGSCKAGPVNSCDDKDICTKDSCNALSGQCVNAQIPGCF